MVHEDYIRDSWCACGYSLVIRGGAHCAEQPQATQVAEQLTWQRDHPEEPHILSFAWARGVVQGFREGERRDSTADQEKLTASYDSATSASPLFAQSLWVMTLSFCRQKPTFNTISVKLCSEPNLCGNKYQNNSVARHTCSTHVNTVKTQKKRDIIF